MNGSGARESRIANASHNNAEPRTSPRIVGEVHANRVPPQFIASISDSAAISISAAPVTSSLCGRSLRGSRRR